MGVGVEWQQRRGKRSGLLFVRSKPENKNGKKKKCVKLKYGCCGVGVLKFCFVLFCCFLLSLTDFFVFICSAM